MGWANPGPAAVRLCTGDASSNRPLIGRRELCADSCWCCPCSAWPCVAVPRPADSACCYFAAKDKDILQPAQKAFITWDPVEKVETFTVQPKFEGNAADFGMVIPTPAKPKLDEMPRDFFKELAVFTILEPMDISKSKRRYPFARAAPARGSGERSAEKAKHEHGQGAGSRRGRLARLQDHPGRARPTTCTPGSRTTSTATPATRPRSTSTSRRSGSSPS